MRDLYDLHIHTNHSDGAKSPKEVVELVKKSNVKTFSITDHDTISGNKEALNYLDLDLTFISGTELSAKSQKGTMHILGYYFDLFDDKFNHKLLDLKQRRIERAYYIFDYLRKNHGRSFDEEDIYNLIYQTNNIGRPHIAELCVSDKYRYASNVDDAFDKYLRDVAKETQDFKLPPNECMSLILDAGGVPILAHPCKLGIDYEELRELVKKHMDYGLKGLEVYHSDHTRKQVYEYMKIVKEFNLQYSVGSDYHGREDNLDVFIGSGRDNNLNVKEMTLHK